MPLLVPVRRGTVATVEFRSIPDNTHGPLHMSPVGRRASSSTETSIYNVERGGAGEAEGEVEAGSQNSGTVVNRASGCVLILSSM